MFKDANEKKRFELINIDKAQRISFISVTSWEI